MTNIITQLSKYILILLMVIYTIRCCLAFRTMSQRRRRRAFSGQTALMLMMHFILNLQIFLHTMTVSSLIFYVAQLSFFGVALFLYRNIYRDASVMLISNMFFLLMLGFCILTRLDFTLAVKQFVIAVVSVMLSLFVPVIVSKVRLLGHLSIVYGVIGIALVASVFVAGKNVYGATNWVSIGGLAFQPSELAKIVFVFFAASMLYKKTDTRRIMITTVIAGGFVLLLVAETDLGAAVIFFATYICMLYVATHTFKWTALGLGLGSAAAAAGYRLFGHVRRRVAAWKDPWGNYDDAGYQICQSLFAIATGGWFGLGLYEGLPDKIPVNKSDFIFSVIAEELGGVFALCLLLIYISCFIMFINISLQLTNNFYKLLAVGLSIAYIFQIFLCVGGVTKFIPHTGVTLPLISYGGSSILSTVIVFAVIQGLYLLKQKEVKLLEEKERELYRQEQG